MTEQPKPPQGDKPDDVEVIAARRFLKAVGIVRDPRMDYACALYARAIRRANQKQWLKEAAHPPAQAPALISGLIKGTPPAQAAIPAEPWDEVRDKLNKAFAIVNALCKPRGTEGHRDWIMSIPADVERDPDIVIGGALRAAWNYLTDNPPAAPLPKAEAPLGAEHWMYSEEGRDIRWTIYGDLTLSAGRKEALIMEAYAAHHAATLRAQLETVRQELGKHVSMPEGQTLAEGIRNLAQIALSATGNNEGLLAENATLAESAERQLSVVREALRQGATQMRVVAMMREPADGECVTPEDPFICFWCGVEHLTCGAPIGSELYIAHNPTCPISIAEAALSDTSTAPALQPTIILDDTLPPNEIRLFSGKSGTRIVDLEMPAPALQEEKRGRASDD